MSSQNNAGFSIFTNRKEEKKKGKGGINFSENQFKTCWFTRSLRYLKNFILSFKITLSWEEGIVD